MLISEAVLNVEYCKSINLILKMSKMDLEYSKVFIWIVMASLYSISNVDENQSLLIKKALLS